MNYYLAPLDGITNYIYRNAYHTHFEKMDKYFTPFISTDPNADLNSSELEDILKENQLDQYLVPQILANNAKEFVKTANAIHTLGYDEINLNLGCPSKAVSARNRGSAFLFHTELLDSFLEDIFTHTKAKISIKTRLGKYAPDEFYALVDIFNKYPLVELIIHPRVQKDIYENTPNWPLVREVIDQFKYPVCLNGDLFTEESVHSLKSSFPENNRIMLGRGIIRNPNLLGMIKHKKTLEIETLEHFHETLYLAYKSYARSDRKILNVMKGLWNQMIPTLPNASDFHRPIVMCNSLADYELLIKRLFEQLQTNQLT